MQDKVRIGRKRTSVMTSRTPDKGSRVELRAWSDGHSLHHEYLNRLEPLLSPAITQFLPLSMAFEQGRDDIAIWMRCRNAEAEVFSVFDREQGELIGLTLFHRDAESRSIFLGYFLGEAYWGRGLATEAVISALNKARRSGVECVFAFVDPKNPASARVLEKCGFSKEPGGSGKMLRFKLQII